ncbi:MAG TPA: hypothetical protein VFC46_11015, partial [Humisphaera sp.]|nr:hypothetical protein [Humisphaera sp.]
MDNRDSGDAPRKPRPNSADADAPAHDMAAVIFPISDGAQAARAEVDSPSAPMGYSRSLTARVMRAFVFTVANTVG